MTLRDKGRTSVYLPTSEIDKHFDNVYLIADGMERTVFSCSYSRQSMTNFLRAAVIGPVLV